MCGIAGVHAYHYAANPVDGAELAAMSARMAARGPDGAGCWTDGAARIGLAHRRLAIIDPSAEADQPMASADGRLVVVFNGEIYNHAELRAELIAKGHVFRTRSDTEVLLHLYAERGVDMVHALRGMFAFAMWDARENTLTLARDPYGIKPLYYSDDGWTVRFASQVKALLAGGALSRDPDPAGAVGFLLFGSVPEPFTMYRAIRAVPAGAVVRVDRAGAGPARRYHAIAQVWRDGAASTAPDAEDRIRAALRDSARAHLVSDVPVGAFLSAGVDSGALVGLMRDAGARDIATVTIGFEEFAGARDDETAIASEVARHYATDHATRIVTRAEFETDLPRILDAMDQPTIDGVNTWFVAKAARERGLKVAVSGVGGDELFGGYPSFRTLPRWVRACAAPGRAPLLGRALRSALAPFAAALGLHPKAAGMVEYGGDYAGAWLLQRGLFMPWELEKHLARDIVAEGLRRLKPLALIDSVLRPRPRSAFARVASLESALYLRNQLLRDADWAGMAHGLEIRTPLVDSVLLHGVAASGWRGQGAKRLLAEAPSRPLPAAVRARAKTGFATPVGQWIAAPDLPARGGPRRGWARGWSKRIIANAGGAWAAQVR